MTASRAGNVLKSFLSAALDCKISGIWPRWARRLPLHIAVATGCPIQHFCRLRLPLLHCCLVGRKGRLGCKGRL
eukprot:9725149-Lingulodinium_polyedra.AAC.1